MRFFKKSELKGILTLIFIILVLAVTMMASTGKLEQWFNVTLFSGPRALDKIVYVSEKTGTADIYIMNTDGADQHQLTTASGIDSTPVVSPLGNKIAFVASTENSSQVYSIGVTGGTPQQMTTATGSKSYPAYRPDGKEFTFISSGKVYKSQPNGEDARVVLPSHEETQAALAGLGKSAPSYSMYAWAPDNVAIAGVSKDENDSDQLVYVPGNKTQPIIVPFGSGSERAKITSLSWAAEAKILTITAVVGKNGVLAIFDPSAPNGQQLKTLGVHKGLVFGRAAVSPDGTNLVVCVRKSSEVGAGALFSADLTTGKMETIGNGHYENMIYSPKGNSILATAIYEHGAKRDIVMILPSAGQINLLTKDGQSYNAVWTPFSEK